MNFEAFGDESSSIEIAGLTIENHLDQVALYGQCSITKDQQGLIDALALQTQLNKIVQRLQNTPLPAEIENKPVVMVDNPFL